MTGNEQQNKRNIMQDSVKYWCMKGGKKVREIETLVELSTCQREAVEKKLGCKMAVVLSQKTYRRYKYKVIIDGQEISRFRSKKILTDIKKRNKCEEFARRYNLGSIRGINIIKIAV